MHDMRHYLVPSIAAVALGTVFTGCGDRTASETEYPAEEVEVTVSQPKEVRVGEQFTRTIEIENETDAVLHQVVLHHDSPAFESSRSKNIGQLKPGQSRTIEQQVTYNREGQQKECFTVDYSPAVCTAVTAVKADFNMQRSLSLEGGAAVDGAAYHCDRIKATYVITNNGDIATQAGTINEKLPEGFATEQEQQKVVLEVPAIEPGDEYSKSVWLQSSSAGKYELKPTLRSGDRTYEMPATTVAVMDPELSLRLEGPKKTYADRSLSYRALVKNTSDDPAKDVEVEIGGIDGLERISVEEGYEFEDNVASIDMLEAGEARTVTITGIAPQPREMTVVATAGAYCVEEISKRVKTQVEGVPALRLEMYDQDDPIALGETTDYTVELKNQGTATDYDVTIAVLVPEGMQFMDGDGKRVGESDGRQRVRLDDLKRIDVGETKQWQFTVKAKDNPGSKRMDFELQSRQLTSPVREQEPTTVTAE